MAKLLTMEDVKQKEGFSKEELDFLLEKINARQSFSKACKDLNLDPVTLRLKLIKHKAILKYKLYIGPYMGKPIVEKPKKRERRTTYVFDKALLEKYLEELNNFELACCRLDSGTTRIALRLYKEGLGVNKRFYFEKGE